MRRRRGLRRALENALGGERERVRELQRAPQTRLMQLVRHSCVCSSVQSTVREYVRAFRSKAGVVAWHNLESVIGHRHATSREAAETGLSELVLIVLTVGN